MKTEFDVFEVLPNRSVKWHFCVREKQLALDIRDRIPGIKTLLVSGYGESLAMMGVEKTEGISYLPKPFSATSLLAAVRKVLVEAGKRTS